MKAGIPRHDVEQLGMKWADDLDFYDDLDPRIVEIEAAELACRYKIYHVSELWDLLCKITNVVFCVIGCQLNSGSTKEVRDHKIA